ncbi:MAG: hypothetical protein HXS50_02845 [Theionarchaea archaeon]|nr:hypothetical protein [Theionarchaea archaeon]
MSMLWLPACTAEVTIAGTPMLELCERAANASWILFQGRLADDPYNPGSFAWSLSHALRAFVRLHRFTGDEIWIDRAVAWIDHMANYTDVNADGKPAWGNYNETWGTDRYDYAEYTVHDGVICIPILELVDCIRDFPALGPELGAKAESYLELVIEIIEYHAEFWTDVSEDSGYYWRITAEDDLIVINQFATLATAEIMVADLTGNESYLARPAKMARFVKNHLVLEPDDCYVWDYSVGGSTEDVSHGTIDLEFMMLAHEHGLTFTLEDMLRLANTYQNRVLLGVEMYKTGIATASHVDGTTDGADHTRDVKTWPYLSKYRPQLYAQHIAAVEVMARTRIPMDRVMARHLAELVELERWFVAEGVDIDSLRPFEPWMVLPEVDALNLSVGRAEVAGVDVTSYRYLVDWLYSNLDEALGGNVSALMESIWSATIDADRLRALQYIELSESLIDRAKDLGIDTSRHELFLSSARQSYEKGLYESAINMCDYPLKLEEMVSESTLCMLFLSILFVSFGTAKAR